MITVPKKHQKNSLPKFSDTCNRCQAQARVVERRLNRPWFWTSKVPAHNVLHLSGTNSEKWWEHCNALIVNYIMSSSSPLSSISWSTMNLWTSKVPAHHIVHFSHSGKLRFGKKNFHNFRCFSFSLKQILIFNIIYIIIVIIDKKYIIIIITKLGWSIKNSKTSHRTQPYNCNFLKQIEAISLHSAFGMHSSH